MKDFTIDGFVAQNVETKATQSGRMVTKFSVNSPDYDRKTQERTPQYFDCEFWHDQGDPKAAMIQEGALLLVWGQLLRAREVAQIRAPQPGRQQGRPQQPVAYAPQAYPQPAPMPQAYPQAAPMPQGYAQPAQYPQQPAAYAPAPQAAPQAAPQPAPAQAPVVEIYDEDIPF